MDSTVIIIAAAAVLLLLALAAIVFCTVRISRLNREKLDLTVAKSSLEARIKAEELIDAEREKAFESQRKQMEESFKTLSEQNSSALRRQNTDSIVELLKPVQEKFEGFEKTVRESGEKSIERDAAMQASIKLMLDQSRTVGEEAKNLANALTGHSKVQGDFGEMLLVDLLKQSGLEEGVHFFTQGVLQDDRGHEIKSDSGATMIPDVIVNYPDGSRVIIDSKVSLTAFVDYMNSENVEERQVLARKHVDSVTKHIQELKDKDYASYIDDNHRKVDYNIMFIPMEGAFRLMLDKAPRLWQQAKDYKVLIVSQQNLMIVLNMIMMSWRQYDQEKNIEEVYKTAGELMSQIKNWLEAYVKVGDSLESARKAYEDSKSKLVDSTQSVIRKIDKLERMKISPKRTKGKIKAGARMVAGQESVIPRELAGGLGEELQIQEETITTE